MAEAARLDELADSLPVPPAEAAAGVGDADVGVASEPAEAPPVAEPPPTSSDDGVDPLDRLLREYDDRNGNGAAASDDDIIAALDAANRDAAAQARNEQEFAAAQARFANDSAKAAMEIAQRDQALSELRGTVEQLHRAAAETQWREHQARAFQDFKSITAEAQARLADIPDVEGNYVETHLLAEAARDPELTRAFDARYYTPPDPLERARLERAIMMRGEDMARAALQIRDPQQRRLAEQYIHAELRRLYANTFPNPAEYRANGAAYLRKALDKIDRQARRPRIDPTVSGDVAAVVAAMKGASGKPSPEPPPNLGKMTDGEFKKYTEQFF